MSARLSATGRILSYLRGRSTYTAVLIGGAVGHVEHGLDLHEQPRRGGCQHSDIGVRNCGWFRAGRRYRRGTQSGTQV